MYLQFTQQKNIPLENQNQLSSMMKPTISSLSSVALLIIGS